MKDSTILIQLIFFLDIVSHKVKFIKKKTLKVLRLQEESDKLVVSDLFHFLFYILLCMSHK